MGADDVSPRGCCLRELDVAGRAGPLCYALAAARLGWWTFPLLPRQKVPDGSLAPHGCRSASCDPAQLERWWATRHEHGVGLACGPSGVVVLDVDPRHGGGEALQALVAGHEWPRTPVQLTGGGGWHYLYRQPVDPVTGEVVRLRGKLAEGVDIKGDGGYIVVAPSVHPSGQRYRWAPEARPSETPLAELPMWALELGRVPVAEVPPPRPPAAPRAGGPSPVERASRYLACLDPSVSGAGGHAALWRAALSLVRGFALPSVVAYDLLVAEFNPRCQPPWSPRELRYKVEQAERAAVGVGYLLDRERR